MNSWDDDIRLPPDDNLPQEPRFVVLREVLSVAGTLRGGIGYGSFLPTSGKLEPGYRAWLPYQPSGDRSPVSVVALDESGNSVGVHPVHLFVSENGTRADFLGQEPVSLCTEVSRIQLLLKGVVAAELTSPSGHAPDLAVNQPERNDVWRHGETRRITWTDNQGHGARPLTVIVSYVAGDAPPVLLKRRLTERFLDIQVDRLKPSDEAQIRVFVSDGLRSAVSESETFTVKPSQ